MVVLLDLDDDDAFDPFARPKRLSGLHTPYEHASATTNVKKDEELSDKATATATASTDTERLNPNLNAFSTALGCYPIITFLASNLDLNTLDALSLTCRQFRHNLLPNRSLLIQQTLRCANETPTPPSPSKPTRRLFLESPRNPCARDLVSACRRCALPICRNCTIKAPSSSRLRQRHRRLCMCCLATPLPELTRHWRDPCTCPSSVYLCVECGTGLSVADTNYRRIWTWRTRYSTYLGGLGTGVGEGNEGVKCWWGEKCVASQEVEVEYCCEEEGASGRGSSSGEDESDGERYWTTEGEGKEERAGYWQQEIEGIGGVVKKKVRKRVRVGKTVKEWEDERDGKEDVLGRESRGEARSWCGWCGRVVWGEKDRQMFGAEDIEGV
ncbi:MAG: hypothetical protein Q9208_007443 [Pyrenodesmia sp. 3 TL-2023]